MLEKLKELVKNTNTRVLGQVLKAEKNRELYKWLLIESASLLPSSTVKERVYFVIQGNPELSCPNGNTKKFSAVRLEYGFCNNIKHCKCFRDQISDERKGADVSYIIEKRRETWLEKYGFENAMQAEVCKNKRKETMSTKNYDESHKKLAYDKETVGFEQVIDRLKDIVTPCFTREEYVGSFRKNIYRWRCNKCGNEFDNHVDYGTEPRCQICYPSNVSIGELELKEWLTSIGVNYISNDRTILGNLELDILIPEKKLAIEFNGTYWHSNKFKGQTYHVDKYLQCKEKDIHLIQIFDDEWYSKKEIVKSRLISILGLAKKIYARLCKVRHITSVEYKEFVEKNHLQGYASAGIRYGLEYNGKLTAVMSFAKARYSREGFEMIRYCSVDTVVGGASKLLSAFTKEYSPDQIVSYANRCWSDGNLYRRLGFADVTIQANNTGFWYVRDYKRYHRSTFNKKRLVKLGYDAALTGDTIMKNAGYMKIFDCGNYKFLLKTERKTALL